MKLDLLTTNLYGRLGAIICWGLDSDNYPITDIDPEEIEGGMTPKEVKTAISESRKDVKKEQRRIGRIIGLLQEIVERDFSKIDGNDLWDIWDALGTFPERDLELERLFNDISTEMKKRDKE